MMVCRFVFELARLTKFFFGRLRFARVRRAARGRVGPPSRGVFAHANLVQTSMVAVVRMPAERRVNRVVRVTSPNAALIQLRSTY